MTRRQAVRALALAVGVSLLVFLLATPPCIWLLSVDGCERMACELLVMRRPMADMSWCEAWFDLFR